VKLYDLHTHSTLSDGEMLPTELVRRAAVLGYTTIAITDHVDSSNITSVITSLRRIKPLATSFGVEFLAGVEITHVPPESIAALARQARKAGADIVVVHGETPVEPVAPGTNLAACSCPDVDILAHPGLLTEEIAHRALDRGIAVEVTSRAGHNRTNGHVARIAVESGCRIVIDSDAHHPGDLLDERAKVLVGIGAGLKEERVREILATDVRKWLNDRRSKG
jgi:histidinol phosphatase-like PHP family hydrolase